MVYFFVIVIFIIRLYFLNISKANEAAILSDGGCEYGVKNTKILTALHILFYIFCVVEAIFYSTKFDTLSAIGLGLITMSFFMLNFIVHRLLKGIWTVKLMVANKHKFNSHWLFRVIKHPNYYLNIFPELIGLALLCHAWRTFIIIAPFYLISIFLRIKEENKIIKEILIPNSKI